MKTNKFLFLFFVVPTFISCTPTDDPESASGTPISFSAAEVAQTKADEVLTTNNLLSMGVFAYYTKQNNWSTGATPNFMHNQLIEKTSSSDPWTYSPMKYWPNTAGDKVSFFAYAPHSSKETNGIITVSDKFVAGYPYLDYVTSSYTRTQIDLLAAAPLLNQTRGSSALSFNMEHKLTRVLFKVKSTDHIVIMDLKIKDCVSTGRLTFTDSGATWTTLSTETKEVKESGQPSVEANTLTEVGEFFLLPRNASSIEVRFTEGGGIYETLTADLPTSPVWEAGGTVVYTLNIECKTEVTMTVTAWANNSSTGNMGQDVPSGTPYPYVLNGVVYESTDKAYYVGQAGKPSGWHSWDAMVKICKESYTSGSYPAGGWRLPNRREIGYIMSKKDINTGQLLLGSNAYWTSEEVNATNAYYAFGFGSTLSLSKGSGCLSLCIRDVTP